MRSHVFENTCQLDLNLSGLGEIEVVFQRSIECQYDAAYGSDADGRRGVPRWSYMDLDFEILQVDDSDGHVVTLTTAQRRAVEDAIVIWAQTHEPKFPNIEEDSDAD